MKEKLRQGNTELAVILEGLASQLQPLDVSINKIFKVYMKEEWNKWMMVETQDEWSRVREDIIVKFLKKNGISNFLDGSEDHLIYEEENDEQQEEES